MAGKPAIHTVKTDDGWINKTEGARADSPRRAPREIRGAHSNIRRRRS